MKELKIRLLFAILGFTFVYFLSSFYNISFNISNWTQYSRFFTVFIGGIMFLALLTFPNYNFKNLK